MIIKNVSARVVRLEDFPDEKPLLPGHTVDLSKYSAQERQHSEQLRALFDRGQLINLGFAPSSKKVAQKAMVTTTPLSKYQIDDPELGSTLMPSHMRTQAMEQLSRQRYDLAPTTTPERYNPEALAQYQYETEEILNGNEIPAFEEKEFEEERAHSFVQVQDEDRVLTVSIDEETGATYVEDLEPGQIPTEYATDPNVFMDRRRYSVEELEDVEARKARVYETLHKQIQEEVAHKCLFPCANGKPCQRSIADGFDRCYQHLSVDDKKKWKRNQKLHR